MHPKAKPNGTFQLAKDSRDVFTLRILDESSNLVFVEAVIQPADLILAITGRADMPITFQLSPLDVLDKIGKVATYRSITLDRNEVDRRTAGWQYMKASNPHRAGLEAEFNAWIEKAAITAAMIIDGEDWKPGWLLKSTGINRQQSSPGHEVTLVRYDDPTPDPSTDEPNQH